jgi:hypothetical protein
MRAKIDDYPAFSPHDYDTLEKQRKYLARLKQQYEVKKSQADYLGQKDWMQSQGAQRHAPLTPAEAEAERAAFARYDVPGGAPLSSGTRTRAEAEVDLGEEAAAAIFDPVASTVGEENAMAIESQQVLSETGKRQVDPNAMKYRYQHQDNIAMLQRASAKGGEAVHGNKAERANMMAGEHTGYRGPYNYPEGDDMTLKFLGGYRSKKGNPSSVWKSMKTSKGGVGQRGKYWKWSAQKQGWARMNRNERQRYMARGKIGNDPVRLPSGLPFSTYLETITNAIASKKLDTGQGVSGLERQVNLAKGSGVQSKVN